MTNHQTQNIKHSKQNVLELMLVDEAEWVTPLTLDSRYNKPEFTNLLMQVTRSVGIYIYITTIRIDSIRLFKYLRDIIIYIIVLLFRYMYLYREYTCYDILKYINIFKSSYLFF